MRLTLGLAKCLLEDLASSSNWRGFCACHPDALIEFEAISSMVSSSDVESIDLERAAEVLRCAAALRVRCDELAPASNG